MFDSQECPQCGARVSAEAPQGLCPQCLLKMGLGKRQSGTEDDLAQASTAYSPPGAPGDLSGEEAHLGREIRESSRFVAPAPSELARHFPQLEILELLGQGGMGAVYKARQPGLDRTVAVKILRPDIGRDPAFAERFKREARALASLSHPNIVTIHDSGQSDELYYFVMEFVDGTTLRQMVQSGGLSSREALAIVPQICEALQYAHNEGIVHRDIKPENLLIDRKGRVKIADFGLAKLLDRDRSDVHLTGSAQVMGTLNYMAPEQIEHPLEVDHRADLYSLGVVFYEMLTGELPLGRFDPPSKRIQVDVRLDRIVLKSLEKEPARRYQHASDVKTDVESLGDEAPTQVQAESSSSEATHRALRELLPFFGAILLYAFSTILLLCASGLAVNLLGEGLEPSWSILALSLASLVMLSVGMILMKTGMAPELPIRFWITASGSFLLVWMITLWLLESGILGLVGSAAAMAATTYGVSRWCLKYLPAVAPELKAKSRAQRVAVDGWGLLLFTLGFIALAPVLHIPGDSSLPETPPSELHDISWVTDLKGAEHRLVKPLRAFQPEGPPLALIKTRTRPGVSTEATNGTIGGVHFRVAGCVLLWFGIRRLLLVRRYRYSWVNLGRPTLVILLCVLGPLRMAAQMPLHFEVDRGGQLQFSGVPMTGAGYLVDGIQDVVCKAGLEDASRVIEQWAEEHQYWDGGTHDWQLVTVPADRRVGEVRLVKYRKRPASITTALRRAWGGPPRPSGVLQLDIRCVSSLNPAETIVAFRLSKFGAGWPEPTDSRNLVNELVRKLKAL